MVRYDASNHEQTMSSYFCLILNLKGHHNCIIGLKVKVILLNWWIFPFGGVASSRVCACSLSSMHFLYSVDLYFLFLAWECNIEDVGR